VRFSLKKGADVSESVAGRIRQERERREWTQQQLADATGIDRDKIGKIEIGARKVNSTELVLISQAFQVPVQDLLRSTTPVVLRRGQTAGHDAEAAVARFNRYVEDSLLTLGLERSIRGH
jgi:transcriptional regulator with XRE-family HTH domain